MGKYYPKKGKVSDDKSFLTELVVFVDIFPFSAFFPNINPLPHNPDFQRPRVKSLLKTLWKTMFFHNVFNPIKDKNNYFS